MSPGLESSNLPGFGDARGARPDTERSAVDYVNEIVMATARR